MRTYLCKELSGEMFTLKADDLIQAEGFASMYGAVVIKEIN